MITTILYYSLISLVVLLTLFIIYIQLQKKSKLHTLYSAIQYFIIQKLTIHEGSKAHNNHKIASKNYYSSQANLLFNHLKTHQDVLYCKKYMKDTLSNVLKKKKLAKEDESKFLQLYQENFPLTTYGDYSSYIDQIKQGKEKILTAGKVYVFNGTSGTSGNRKLIPHTENSEVGYYCGCAMYECVLESYINKTGNGFYKSIAIEYPNNPIPIEGSKILVRFVTIDEEEARWKTLFCTAPLFLYDYRDASREEMNYVYALFGLYDEDLVSFDSIYINTIYGFVLFLMENIDKLCDDLKYGNTRKKGAFEVLNKNHPELYAKCLASITPSPERAEKIRSIVKNKKEGMAKKIWPRLKVVISVCTGDFKSYLKKLEFFFKGVANYSPFYGASEAFYGVSLEVGKLNYTLIHRGCFFEFISMKDSKLYLSNELRVGEKYEMVITTFNGMFRYKCGDVIKVVDFYGTIPTIEFCYRLSSMLNIMQERTSEINVRTALKFFQEQHKGCVIKEFTTSTNDMFKPEYYDLLKLKNEEPRYFIYVELEGSDFEFKTKEHSAVLDKLMGKANPFYEKERTRGSIAEMCFLSVKSGFFKELKELMEKKTENSNLFKVPRKLKHQSHFDLIMKSIQL